MTVQQSATGASVPGSANTSAAAPAVRRVDVIFLLILLVALVLRVYLAGTEPYIHDEDNAAIPFSETISFDPQRLHVPLRAQNHPALPAYVVKASGALFGTSRLGYRALHVLLSLCAITLIYVAARRWYGPVAARWAAALLAFNEYFLGVSARATAHVPYLFFVSAALFAFSRFLAVQRTAYLYAAAVATGLAFYCKEHSVLLLPVFFLTLLHPRWRHSFRTPHAYLACATFFLVVAPDITWNLTRGPEMVHITYGANENVAQATYRSHLQRIGGVGFSPYPLMFYGRSMVRSLYAQLTGRELIDETPEYRSINPGLGALLLIAVLITTVRPRQRDGLRLFLLTLFWCVFGFFTLIEKGSPPGRLDPVSWIWVEVTLLPAVILTGLLLSALTGRARLAAWTLSASLLLAAGGGAMLDVLDNAGQQVVYAVDVTGSAMDDGAAALVPVVRSHPLRAVAAAAAAGMIAGSLLGFACGWLVRSVADPSRRGRQRIRRPDRGLRAPLG